MYICVLTCILNLKHSETVDITDIKRSCSKSLSGSILFHFLQSIGISPKHYGILRQHDLLMRLPHPFSVNHLVKRGQCLITVWIRSITFHFPFVLDSGVSCQGTSWLSAIWKHLALVQQYAQAAQDFIRNDSSLTQEVLERVQAVQLISQWP